MDPESRAVVFTLSIDDLPEDLANDLSNMYSEIRGETIRDFDPELLNLRQLFPEIKHGDVVKVEFPDHYMEACFFYHAHDDKFYLGVWANDFQDVVPPEMNVLVEFHPDYWSEVTESSILRLPSDFVIDDKNFVLFSYGKWEGMFIGAYRAEIGDTEWFLSVTPTFELKDLEENIQMGRSVLSHPEVLLRQFDFPEEIANFPEGRFFEIEPLEYDWEEWERRQPIV